MNAFYTLFREGDYWGWRLWIGPCRDTAQAGPKIPELYPSKQAVNKSAKVNPWQPTYIGVEQ